VERLHRVAQHNLTAARASIWLIYTIRNRTDAVKGDDT
jgi:hypothetical protein